MRVPFAQGFPLDRWSNSVHCMLQKKKQPFINKLRIIQLFEADFNSALKYVLGRKLLYYSEEQSLNSTQTHGSRPGRSTHDALKINTLSYDIARLERIKMITLFNDATGCYDRMRHNLTTITTRRMGCPKEFALCHARVQNQMKHYIKTKAGVSPAFFQASPSLNIGGLGQGNGGGPISWHCHMEPLLEAYSKDNPGFSFTDPTGMLCFLQWIVGFVDDNSLNITFREGQTVQEALQQAQTALFSWKKLLQITGGDLALEKCVYSFMGWVLAKGGETLGSISDFPGTIEMLSKSGDPTVIKL